MLRAGIIPFSGALLLLACGCAVRQTIPEAQRRAGHVYFMRGWLDVFSGGMGTMTARLNRENVDAYDGTANLAGPVADAVRKLRKTGDREPIIIGGHSIGADNAVRAAQSLADDGIAVDLLVLLDDFTPPPVPRNVKHVVVLTGRGSSVRVAEPYGPWRRPPTVEVVSVNALPVPVLGLLVGQMQHFGIDDDPRVHDKVVAEVLRICPTRAVWAARMRTPAPPDTGAPVVLASAVSPPSRSPSVAPVPAPSASSRSAAPQPARAPVRTETDGTTPRPPVGAVPAAASLRTVRPPAPALP